VDAESSSVRRDGVARLTRPVAIEVPRLGGPYSFVAQANVSEYHYPIDMAKRITLLLDLRDNYDARSWFQFSYAELSCSIL
jgi:hypothetical protein